MGGKKAKSKDQGGKCGNSHLWKRKCFPLLEKLYYSNKGKWEKHLSWDDGKHVPPMKTVMN